MNEEHYKVLSYEFYMIVNAVIGLWYDIGIIVFMSTLLTLQLYRGRRICSTFCFPSPSTQEDHPYIEGLESFFKCLKSSSMPKEILDSYFREGSRRHQSAMFQSSLVGGIPVLTW